MKKERDQALHGKSLALGKLHKSIIGTDVEGKIDNYFKFFRDTGGGGPSNYNTFTPIGMMSP